MANYSFTFKDDSLEHHGIDGQKWGVRNGPPYPLAAGDHSAAEKRAMRKNYKVVKNTKLIRSHLTNPLKNKNLANNVADVLNSHRSEVEGLLAKNPSWSTVESICHNIARECLGKYAGKQVIAKVKGVLTDFGVAKYGTSHAIGTAEDVLAKAIYYDLLASASS